MTTEFEKLMANIFHFQERKLPGGSCANLPLTTSHHPWLGASTPLGDAEPTTPLGGVARASKGFGRKLAPWRNLLSPETLSGEHGEEIVNMQGVANSSKSENLNFAASPLKHKP